MKILRLICMLLAAVCMGSPIGAYAYADFPAYNAETDDPELSAGTGANLLAAGLISSYYIVCTAGTGSITFSSRTNATQVVAKIGQKNIRVQRSTNGTDGWTDYLAFADHFSEDVTFCYFSPETVSVPSGYYRIILTHYAKEKGWFFPKTQSVEQTSVVVHVG